jgi:hypothetical protein
MSMILHRGAQPTTLEALRTLPVPPPLGPHHKPVPHAELVEAITGRLTAENYEITRSQLAVTPDGHRLFGMVDINNGGSGWARQLGFRNSTDQSFQIRGVAGRRVLICDNMVLSGEEFSFTRKNTTGLTFHGLFTLVKDGIARWREQIDIVGVKIEALNALPLPDVDAKAIAYDALVQGVIPKNLLEPVHANYFGPEPTEDCAPRTRWGLHNAFTRAMRDLKPQPLFERTVALGRFFGI